MDETIQKWNHEFNIQNPDSEPTTFLLLKDYLDSFNNHKANHIVDEQNRIIINERVAEKSSILKGELDNKSEEVSELSEEVKHLTCKCNDLYTELDSEKQNKTLEIDKAVKQAVSAKEEIIQLLKGDKEKLASESAEWKEIISNFTKDNTCSSQKLGEIGEKEFLKVLQSSSSPWESVDVTNQKGHSGDFIVNYKDKKYIIDVKNWTSDIRGDEVRKLARDIEDRSCDGGAIISLKEGVGILDPSKNQKVKQCVQTITVQGKSISLISNASLLEQDVINSVLLELLYCESTSDNNTILTDNKRREFHKYIMAMEKDIESERISFNKRITKKQNQLEDFKTSFKELINGYDDLSDDDSPKPKSKNRPSVKEMRKKLKEDGHIEETKLKGDSLRTKFNELYPHD